MVYSHRFVDGSRLCWALLSPVHERSGYRAHVPDRIQGDAVLLPHSTFTAQSRITSRRSARDQSPRPSKPRAVLAVVKAWPGESGASRTSTVTASLDGGCARRSGWIAVGTEKRLSRTKKLLSCLTMEELVARPTS